jgi:hypothetical protein
MEMTVTKESNLSNMHLFQKPSFKIAAGILPLRRVARKLLRCLQHSRARTAQRILRDYRHLVCGQ